MSSTKKRVNIVEDESADQPEVSDLSSRTRAKERWKALLVGFTADKTAFKNRLHSQKGGLIAELKRSKKEQKKGPTKEGVLSLLQSQANLTKKVFEKQKYSVREILSRNSEEGFGKRWAYSSRDSDLNHAQRAKFAMYNTLAKQKYPITPEIRVKLNKIKQKNREADRRREDLADSDKMPGFIERLFMSTVLGQTLRAYPRFYSMDPHEHLPELCRRCRRPLKATLISRFTAAGILFAILLPVLGILLLYANREFICVICEEAYVYGDLTARPQNSEE